MKFFLLAFFAAFFVAVAMAFFKALGVLDLSWWLIASPVWGVWLAALFCICYSLLAALLYARSQRSARNSDRC